MPELAIEVRGLRKSYGELQAVDGIDLEVRVGEVFALLGPNGAGKTTTVEVLEGHRKRTSGDVRVLGFDPGRTEAAFKQRIGIVLQETAVEIYLTVEEVIDLYRGYYPDPLPRDEVIELVGLADKRRERVNRLSGGQQRRLDVAVGLCGNPQLLFLDEPTTGFDPSARRNAWQMIDNLRALGKTILLTTHYMEEAQHLADRVAILVQGRIVAQGAPDELIARDAHATTIRFRLAPGVLLPDSFEAASSNGRVVIRTTDPVRELNRVTAWALDNGVVIEDLNVSKRTLEDIYLELTGRRGVDA